jgi:murein L,D-transpeptidase YcbB/YkuD
VRTGFKAAVAAAVLAVAGCDNISIGGGSGGGGGSGQAAPQVAPEELRAAVQDERVRRFYEARQWRAAWNGEQEQALVAALRDSARHGLDPRRYLQGVEGQSAGAAREAALSLAAITYAGALARGQADPARLHEIYEIPRPEADVAAGLAQAVEQGNVAQWLGSLAPQDAEYRALSEAYLRYSEAASREQAPAVNAGRGIRVGDRDPRVPAIAAALRSHGYLAAPAAAQQPQGQQPAQGKQPEKGVQPKQPQAAAEPTRYTEEMAAAVRRVQEDYGINPDGVVGSGTLDILNATARDRARQLAVNLERRRWLARQAPATRIDVNTAAAFLEYHRDGQLMDTRRVMVGQPDWETPPLQSPIVRLVANPPWTVPESIEQEELLPKGPAYLARNNFSRNRNGRLVQEPGPESALGEVKLDMSNRHAIYLHDTPHKSGFGRAERHMSHGCVRVQDAVGFATMLAEHDGKSDQFARALARRSDEGKPQETPVQLANPIPVRLLYHSVYLDRSGRLLFRPDPYGWDETVAQALGLAARQRASVRRHAGDVGP